MVLIKVCIFAEPDKRSWCLPRKRVQTISHRKRSFSDVPLCVIHFRPIKVPNSHVAFAACHINVLSRTWDIVDHTASEKDRKRHILHGRWLQPVQIEFCQRPRGRCLFCPVRQVEQRKLHKEFHRTSKTTSTIGKERRTCKYTTWMYYLSVLLFLYKLLFCSLFIKLGFSFYSAIALMNY